MATSVVEPYPRREDTAEYGLGMALGSQQRRERLVEDVKELLEEVPRQKMQIVSHYEWGYNPYKWS